MSKFSNNIVLSCLAGLFLAGCVVYVPQPQPTSVAVDQPVITDPGVVAIDVEPPPDDRVYVYDPGFPPGVYFYNDYYWYNGYRYPHDVFINRYVTVNVRENRFINVDENRRLGQRIEVEHRQDFAANHGVHRGHAPAADQHPEHREHE
jgi:hypothetical protein